MAMAMQRELDEAAIRQQIGNVVESIHAKDLDGLRLVYAEDVVSFDVEPPLEHVGVEAKLKNWGRVFTVFREVEYEVRNLVLTVGDEVAFARLFGRLHGTLANGAATEGMWVRGTLCFQKRAGVGLWCTTRRRCRSMWSAGGGVGS
ncbi:YybH family protein [Catenulispora yoronensis]